MGLGLGTRLGEYKDPENQVPVLRRIKGSVELNGSNDAYYDALVDGPLDHEVGFSISGVFNVDNTSTQDVLVAFDTGLSGGEKTAVGFFVGGGRFKFGAMFDDEGSHYYWDDTDVAAGKTSGSVSSDVWYHLVGTAIFADSAWTTTFYVNGVAQTGAFTWNNYVECGSLSGYGIVGGDRIDVSERRLDGKFNNIGKWQGILSQSQVTALYNNGFPRSPLNVMRGPEPVSDLSTSSRIVGCWKFSHETDYANHTIITGVPPAWTTGAAFDLSAVRGDDSTDYMGA